MVLPGTLGAARSLYPGVGVGGRNSFVGNLRIQNLKVESNLGFFGIGFDDRFKRRCHGEWRFVAFLRPKAETGEPMVFYKKLQVWILFQSRFDSMFCWDFMD